MALCVLLRILVFIKDLSSGIHIFQHGIKAVKLYLDCTSKEVACETGESKILCSLLFKPVGAANKVLQASCLLACECLTALGIFCLESPGRKHAACT